MATKADTRTKAEEEAAEAEAPESEAPEGDGQAPTLSALSDKVDSLAEAVGKLLRGGTKAPARGTKADEAEDVRAQVRDEVGKLKAAEDAESKRRGEIESLRDQVKKLAERAPVEYRKITRWMWGDSDE
jgi:hypothetical protein